MPPSDLEMHNSGYLPSPEDVRDYIAEDAAPVWAGLPLFFKTDISALPVLMQGKQPSCIAHAVTWYVMWLIWKKTGKVVKLSPRFLYALCKQQDGLPDTEGTFFRVALSIAKNQGICEDSFFPNTVTLDKNTYKDASLIPQGAYENAQQHKITNYYRVKDTSFTGMFRAAYQNALCLMGMRISSEWWQREDGTPSWAADDLMPLRPADAQHPVVSGHAVTIYASGMNLQYIMNWWSAAWGYMGHGWYGRNNIPYVFEAWTIDGVTTPITFTPIPKANLTWSTTAPVESSGQTLSAPTKNMNTNFSFTYWVGKLATLAVLVSPIVFHLLPAGWENITLGVFAHGLVDYLNQTYHSA